MTRVNSLFISIFSRHSPLPFSSLHWHSPSLPSSVFFFSWGDGFPLSFLSPTLYNLTNSRPNFTTVSSLFIHTQILCCQPSFTGLLLPTAAVYNLCIFQEICITAVIFQASCYADVVSPCTSSVNSVFIVYTFAIWSNGAGTLTQVLRRLSARVHTHIL